jgi:diguanylate cyclase (GGDEF)-like protein/PAS domain S-box-containing protein
MSPVTPFESAIVIEPTRDDPQLFRSLVDHATDLIVTLDGDGTITYANQVSQVYLGFLAEELIGRNAVDLVHPDDVGRALDDLNALSEFGAPLGTTTFRLRHADGRWVTLDITSSDVPTDEGGRVALHGRPAEDRRATDEVVVRLLRGGTRRELLAPLCDLFDWRVNGTRIAIAWFEPNLGWQSVSTDLPDDLVGIDDGATGPWQRSRDQSIEICEDADQPLDPARRQRADELGLSTYWIVPIADSGGRLPATITVWGGPRGHPRQVHAYGMSVARTFVDLILRWSHQVQRLDSAAHTDELTGLANRKAFFDRLDAVTEPGALLYCDLDRFKSVNDALGHSAGDALLRQVAARFRHAVRTQDLVARIGGDEFAILCVGADVELAESLSARTQAAFADPFAVAGHTVEIGISIGVAHAPQRLGRDTLEMADQTLYQVKARRRSPTVR